MIPENEEEAEKIQVPNFKLESDYDIPPEEMFQTNYSKLYRTGTATSI